MHWNICFNFFNIFILISLVPISNPALNRQVSLSPAFEKLSHSWVPFLFLPEAFPPASLIWTLRSGSSHSTRDRPTLRHSDILLSVRTHRGVFCPHVECLHQLSASVQNYFKQAQSLWWNSLYWCFYYSGLQMTIQLFGVFFFKMIIVTCLIYPEYCSVKLVDGFGSLEWWIWYGIFLLCQFCVAFKNSNNFNLVYISKCLYIFK